MYKMLEKVFNRIDDLNRKMDKIIADKPLNPDIRSVDLLLELPNHLRRTLLAIAKLDCPCTAIMVSNITGRTRARESTCLSQLRREGFLNKERKGKLFYYSYIIEGNVNDSKSF